MAAGFSVKDALNKNSKAGIDESPRARFRTKDISIFKMYRNDMNFYSVEQVEELAGDILMYGLKQNLELVYAPCEKGEYRIVYRLLCILIEHDKIALVAKILTDAGVEIDAEQTKTLVGCIAFDDISGALEILQEIGITGAMFDELKEIIEEMRKGVPLGYFTSQWFGNFYLKALDHYIKEELHAEHYMRYMDDMVILGKSKKKLHKIHAAIETYLNDNLDLEIKGDWQVFRFEYPVFDKGGNPVLDKDGKQVTKGRMLDFMGFQFHHDRTTIRKSNIEAARRKANHISKQDKISWYNASVMLSYMGLFKHTDTYNYYIDYIKPKINVKKLKRIVSKHSRKENEHDRLEKGDRNTAGQAGGGRQNIVAVNGLPA